MLLGTAATPPARRDDRIGAGQCGLLQDPLDLGRVITVATPALPVPPASLGVGAEPDGTDLARCHRAAELPPLVSGLVDCSKSFETN
jgi:hypothetical protein